MATLAEVVYTIAWQAQKGQPSPPRWDIDYLLPIAESLLPSIFQRVGETVAGDERKRSLLKRNVTLTFASGSATIPDYVLKAYLEDSQLMNTDDLSIQYSWVREFFDFASTSLQNPPWSNLGYYNNSGGDTILIIEPGEAYDPSGGTSGDKVLNIPCTPVKPDAEDDDLDVTEEVLNEIYDVGVAMLQGEMSKRAAELTIT